MSSLVGEHPRVEPLLEGRAGAQRARLLEAMTAVVGEKGYAAATVADAVRAARVSRGTFYALFDSKEACFLEGYRHGVEVLDARIDAAVRATPGDWRAKLRAAVHAYLASLDAEPRFARAHLFEIHVAGPAAGAARDITIRRFAQRYRASFAAAGDHRPTGDPRQPSSAGAGVGPRLPSDDALFVLSAGVDQLVCAHMRTGGRAADLEDTLVDVATTLGGPWT